MAKRREVMGLTSLSLMLKMEVQSAFSFCEGNPGIDFRDSKYQLKFELVRVAVCKSMIHLLFPSPTSQAKEKIYRIRY